MVTCTIIVTFLMVFLIPNAKNRSAKLVKLKLDELLRAIDGELTGFVDLDNVTDDELAEVREEFHRLREKYAPLVEDNIRNIETALSSRQRRH